MCSTVYALFFVTGYSYALTKNCVGGEVIEDE